jgi:hypothetical protein
MTCARAGSNRFFESVDSRLGFLTGVVDWGGSLRLTRTPGLLYA